MFYAVRELALLKRILKKLVRKKIIFEKIIWGGEGEGANAEMDG